MERRTKALLRDGFREVLSYLVFFVLAYAFGMWITGCGPRRTVIAREYEATKAHCVELGHALIAECPAGAPCLERLHKLRATCDRALADVCSSRRARRMEACQ